MRKKYYSLGSSDILQKALFSFPRSQFTWEAGQQIGGGAGNNSLSIYLISCLPLGEDR